MQFVVASQAHLPLACDVVYHYWNERSWYPQFIPGVRGVEVIDEVWSRWLLGSGERCEVELTDNILHHYLAWRVHDEHDHLLRVWIDEDGQDAAWVRLEILWRPGPGAPNLAGQQQRADRTLELFAVFAASEPELGLWSRGRFLAPN